MTRLSAWRDTHRMPTRVPICAICDNAIVRGETYYAGIITPAAANKLVDDEVPALTPAMRPREDGSAELAICEACAAEMDPEPTLLVRKPG